MNAPESSDRLATLRRQRAFLQDHLAWIDAEIAAATGTPSTSVEPPAAAVPSGAVSESTAPAEVSADADAILAEYRGSPGAVEQDVRRGCFLYFAAGLVLLALGGLVVYLAFRH